MNFERQHIVPRSYLRRFATKIPKKKRYQIGVIDKSGRAFSQSIDNVGYVKNYYDTNCREDKKHWEHYFANEIEPHYGRDLDLIITKVYMSQPETVILNEYDKKMLTIMMCFQIMRNPQYIDRTIDDMPQFIDGFKKGVIKQNPWLSPEQVRLIKRINYSKDKCKDELLKII